MNDVLIIALPPGLAFPAATVDDARALVLGICDIVTDARREHAAGCGCELCRAHRLLGLLLGPVTQEDHETRRRVGREGRDA